MNLLLSSDVALVTARSFHPRGRPGGSVLRCRFKSLELRTFRSAAQPYRKWTSFGGGYGDSNAMGFAVSLGFALIMFSASVWAVEKALNDQPFAIFKRRILKFIAQRGIFAGNRIYHDSAKIKCSSTGCAWCQLSWCRPSFSHPISPTMPMSAMSAIQAKGSLRTVYFAILISHTILAAVIVPLVLRTLYLALKNRFDDHRRWARWTLPLWFYVSVTGVVIYEMLY